MEKYSYTTPAGETLRPVLPRRKDNPFWAPRGIWAILCVILLVTLFLFYDNFYRSFFTQANGSGVYYRSSFSFENYEAFFSLAAFPHILGNSFFMSGLALVGALALGIPLGLLVSRIRGRWRFAGLFPLLAAAFIPAICWFSWLYPNISKGPYWGLLGFCLIVSVQGGGMVGAVLALYAMSGRRIWQGMGWVMLLWAFRCLSPDLGVSIMTTSPIARAFTENMGQAADFYGFARGNNGLGMTINIVQSLGQLAFGGIVWALAYLIFVRRHKGESFAEPAPEGNVSFGSFALLIIALAVGGLLLMTPALAWRQVGSALWDKLIYCSVVSYFTFCNGLLVSWCLIRTLRSTRWGVFGLWAGLFLALRVPQALQSEIFNGVSQMNSILRSPITLPFSTEGFFLALLLTRLTRAEPLQRRPVFILAMVPALFMAANAWSDIYGSFADPERTSFSSVLRSMMVGGMAQDMTTYLLTLLPTVIMAALAALVAMWYMAGKGVPERATKAAFTQAVMEHPLESVQRVMAPPVDGTPPKRVEAPAPPPLPKDFVAPAPDQPREGSEESTQVRPPSTGVRYIELDASMEAKDAKDAKELQAKAKEGAQTK